MRLRTEEGYRAAIGHFAEGCSNGEAKACEEFGRHHVFHGWFYTYGVPSKASDAFARACELGLKSSCAYLAPDSPEGVRKVEELCVAGNTSACARITTMEGGPQRISEEQLARAKSLLEEGCRGQDSTRCVERGLLEVGLGEHANAVSWLHRSCDLENSLGCKFLGHMLVVGQGVPVDSQQSLVYYGKACDLAFGEACAVAANMTELGVGTKSDDEKANVLYGRACELGFGGGCNNLAMAVVDADPAKAVTLLRRGCELADASSCWNLGRCLEHGIGTKADAVRARKLYKDACAQGLEQACKSFAEIDGKPLSDSPQAP